MLSGLSQLNIELTSKCDKYTLCGFCGHQDPDIFPKLEFGDMDWGLLVSIRDQLSPGVVIQFHRDGEPTVYPRLKEALGLFAGFTTSIVTHGENLSRRTDDIIDNCTTVTVSAFKGDPDEARQLESVKAFIEAKGDRRPRILIKIVGDYFNSPWESLGVPIIRRLIHVPGGSYKYAHHKPTVPEIGICLDFLHHPSIDWKGRVFMCNRLDPDSKGVIGDATRQTLDDIWNSHLRAVYLDAHQAGRRQDVPPCVNCDFYGVPSEWRPPIKHPLDLITVK